MEIVAFDDEGAMVGTLLMTLRGESGIKGMQIETSFGDGYATVVVLENHRETRLVAPEAGMIEGAALHRRCATHVPESESQPVTVWWKTDLADPCDAPARVSTILQLAGRELAELDVRIDAQHKPTVKQCMLKFAIAGTLCGFSIIFPVNIGLAIGCAIKVFEGWCDCSEYLPIEVC